MAESARHRVAQHRTGIAGVEALSLESDRAFPRHSHAGYGIGVVLFGAHRSWSGRGAVAGEPGDVITVNPGEIHDGLPVAGAVRGWRMLYLDPAAMVRETADDLGGELEIARPALHDPEAASAILRAFARLAAGPADALAAEESLLVAVMHVVRRHGARRPARPGPSAPVGRALRRLDDAPERPVTLAELAALTGVGRFQLLRGFAREVGTTPPRLSPAAPRRSRSHCVEGGRRARRRRRDCRLRGPEPPHPRLRAAVGRHAGPLSRRRGGLIRRPRDRPGCRVMSPRGA